MGLRRFRSDFVVVFASLQKGARQIDRRITEDCIEIKNNYTKWRHVPEQSETEAVGQFKSHIFPFVLVRSTRTVDI